MAETEVAKVDYSTMSVEQLYEELGQAYNSKDYKLMKTLTGLVTKAEQGAEKVAKEALLAELQETTSTVETKIKSVLDKLINEGKLDGAEGVWFAWDFGDGETTACRLMKSSRKASSGEGSGSGSGSYISHPAKSADLLAEVGGQVMFEEDTEVQIDKEPLTMPAGMTFKEAYDFSTNGGWRNRIRMSLLKAAGKI